MARTRAIKPDFFKNEMLAKCSFPSRLAFAGLWCLADCEGRLEDRPERIRAELFPYDAVDMDALLDQLAQREFIQRYVAQSRRYIWIVNFTKHQHPHPKERQKGSQIPAPVPNAGLQAPAQATKTSETGRI